MYYRILIWWEIKLIRILPSNHDEVGYSAIFAFLLIVCSWKIHMYCGN